MKIACPKCDFRPTPNLLSHSAHLHCNTPFGQAVPAHTCPPTRYASGIIMAGGVRECRNGDAAQVAAHVAGLRVAHLCDARHLPTLFKDVARYPMPHRDASRSHRDATQSLKGWFPIPEGCFAVHAAGVVSDLRLVS